MINFAHVYLMTAADADIQELISDAMQKTLDTIIPLGNDFLAAIKKEGPEDNPKPRWMTDQEHPSEITALLADATPDTLTFSGNLYGTTLTRTLLNNVVAVGTVLQKYTSTGAVYQCVVDAFTSSSSLIAEVSHYGNTDANVEYDTGGATTWTIVSTPAYDARAFTQGMFIKRDFLYTYTQIFQDFIEIELSRKILGMKVVADELQHQIDKVMRKIRFDLAKVVIHGRPYYSSGYKGHFDVQAATMAGVQWWHDYAQASLSQHANLDVDKSGASLTKDMLEDLAANMRDYADVNWKSNDANYEIWCHPWQADIINTFDEAYRRTTADRREVGFMNDAIWLQGKKVPVKTDMLWPMSRISIIPTNKISYGDMKNDALSLKVHPSVPRVDKKEVSFQCWGLKFRNPVQSGRLKNLATT